MPPIKRLALSLYLTHTNISTTLGRQSDIHLWSGIKEHGAFDETFGGHKRVQQQERLPYRTVAKGREGSRVGRF